MDRGFDYRVFPSRAPGAPLVVFLADHGEGEQVLSALAELGALDLSLAVIGGFDWNRDLSPWPAPGVMKGGGDFAGGADDFLARLTAALPEIAAALPPAPAYMALAGYSLAGLCAVYAAYRADAFTRFASASGSFWYPGFLDFARTQPFRRVPERVYVSVGDREARTRNPRMQPVEENTRQLAAWYAEQGIETCFELNPGNHFQDPAGRMARGILWMVQG